MVTPAAMNIESATDTLCKVPESVLKDQRKELVSAIGAATADRLFVKFPLSHDFVMGYMIGLQTARAIIAGSAEVLLKGGKPDSIL